MNGVLVDRELLKEAKLIAECFASSRHAAASVQKNPAVAAALLEEMERAERLENQLRAALALPVQAAADAAELHRLAVEASRTDSTSSAVRHARDELVRVCLSLGGES